MHVLFLLLFFFNFGNDYFHNTINGLYFNLILQLRCTCACFICYSHDNRAVQDYVTIERQPYSKYQASTIKQGDSDSDVEIYILVQIKYISRF